jgi:mannitol-1-phosphate 5-dehydrogenase
LWACDRGLSWLRTRAVQALANEAVFKDVHGALRESGAALVSKHGFDAEAHERYVERVLARIANPKLHDDVVRVGRQSLRKLAKGDRLLGPMVTLQKLDHIGTSTQLQCSTGEGDQHCDACDDITKVKSRS